MYKFIREEDDIKRAGRGCYSPTRRDDAQDARNSEFNLICDTPGEESYYALIEIANMWKDIPIRHTRIKHLAVERAEKDAEFSPLTESKFIEFSRGLGTPKDGNINIYNNCNVTNNDNKIDYGSNNTLISSPIFQGVARK